jgi:hypothetical protein
MNDFEADVYESLSAKGIVLKPQVGVLNSVLIWPPLIQGNPADLFWLVNVTEQPTIPVTLPSDENGVYRN